MKKNKILILLIAFMLVFIVACNNEKTNIEAPNANNNNDNGKNNTEQEEVNTNDEANLTE